MRCKPDRDERGSALLIVFLFAAIVAIMLYKAMPDVVFEAQRQKEQILMDRGHEYKVAIKRFLARNKTYPTSLEQLDNFNNLRYIRRRYKDPMTGQNEWRLIHVMTPGFILTDSKVTPLKNGINGLNGAQSNGGGFAQTNSSGFGNNNNSGFGSKQSSFGSSSNQSGFGSSSNQSGFGSNQSSFDSNQSKDETTDPNAPPEPTAAQLYGAQRRPPATPSETMPGGQNANPDDSLAEPLPVPAPADGQPANGNAKQASGAQGANPGAPNNGGAGANADPNNPAASALNAVNSSLRQQGATPVPATKNSTFGSSTFGTINSGGGIAGVASKAKGSSIKVMDGQTDYSKWEFVYNPQKDAAAGLQGAANRMNSNANRTQNSNNSGGFSTNSGGFNSNSGGFGSNSSSSFGSNSSSGFGSNSSSFGSSSSGFGSSTQSQSRTPSQ
jgi:hypothetical protein